MSNLDFSRNTELISQEQIEGTPFKMVKTEEGNFIAIGVKRVTELMDEVETEIKVAELKRQDWKFLLAILSVVTQETVAQLHLDMMKVNEEYAREEGIEHE